MTRRMVPKISELQLLLPVPVQFGFFGVLFVGWQEVSQAVMTIQILKFKPQHVTAQHLF